MVHVENVWDKDNIAHIYRREDQFEKLKVIG